MTYKLVFFGETSPLLSVKRSGGLLLFKLKALLIKKVFEMQLRDHLHKHNQLHAQTHKVVSAVE